MIQIVDLGTLELRIARSENLPVLNAVAVSVLKLAQDPDSPARAYEKAIERDPALAGKVLRVASSALYAVGDVANIGRAIAVLGMTSLKSLVVTLAYQQSLEKATHSEYLDPMQCWRHSLATAVAARILAKLRMPAKSEELYMAGLVHDVGLLAMDKFCPQMLDQSLRVAAEQGIPLHLAETKCCGFNHAAVGAILADRWSLSKVARTAIRYHLDPFESKEDVDQACLLSAANYVAYECGYKNNSSAPDDGFDSLVMEALGIPQEQFPPICEVVKSEIAKAEAAFHIPNRARAA